MRTPNCLSGGVKLSGSNYETRRMLYRDFTRSITTYKKLRFAPPKSDVAGLLLYRKYCMERLNKRANCRILGVNHLSSMCCPPLCSRGSSFVYLVDSKPQSLYNLPGKEASGSHLLLGLLWDHEVGGSNPPTPTTDRKLRG